MASMAFPIISLGSKERRAFGLPVVFLVISEYALQGD
jgi:hypothetical protein